MEEKQTKKPEKLNLLDFDLLGMIELKDAEGIEELVTPVGDGTFISRGKAFCIDTTCAEASKFRESLKKLLAQYPEGKKAFVIADHMANLSGKVYYEEIQRAINKKDYSGIGAAKKALTEDIGNIISLIEGRPATIPESVLPESEDRLATRIIECNNMALLYIFTKNFDVPKGYNILNTGLGGIFIGPFFKNIYGTRWTNLLKSKYVDEIDKEQQYDVFNRTVSPGLFKNKKVLLLDDNIGTGQTAREIETEFNIKGYDIKSGAVQYNWINFYLVGIGAKDIPRFNPSEVEYITQFNYPGHKLIDHAFKMLAGQRDLERNEPSQDKETPPGMIYKKYKQLKGYSKPGMSDIITLQERGIDYCKKAGIPVVIDEYAGTIDLPKKVFTEESARLMQGIKASNKQMFRQAQGMPFTGIEKPRKKGSGMGDH